jgi:hypothetical protein
VPTVSRLGGCWGLRVPCLHTNEGGAFRSSGKAPRSPIEVGSTIEQGRVQSLQQHCRGSGSQQLPTCTPTPQRCCSVVGSGAGGAEEGVCSSSIPPYHLRNVAVCVCTRLHSWSHLEQTARHSWSDCSGGWGPSCCIVFCPLIGSQVAPPEGAVAHPAVRWL